MAEFKLTISDPKTGKTVQREVKDTDANVFIGKKIGEPIKGESVNLTGYEFEISGGSDYCGFPMRRDIPGTGRKRILAVRGVGIKKQRKGQKQRKTVCGNTIHARISQINLKILKEGKEKLFESVKEGVKPKEEKKVEEKAEEKKEAKEEKKEKAKKEEKAEEKKEAKPKEKKKEQEKPKEEKKQEKPKKEN